MTDIVEDFSCADECKCQTCLQGEIERLRSDLDKTFKQSTDRAREIERLRKEVNILKQERVTLYEMTDAAGEDG